MFGLSRNAEKRCRTTHITAAKERLYTCSENFDVHLTTTVLVLYLFSLFREFTMQYSYVHLKNFRRLVSGERCEEYLAFYSLASLRAAPH